VTEVFTLLSMFDKWNCDYCIYSHLKVILKWQIFVYLDTELWSWWVASYEISHSSVSYCAVISVECQPTKCNKVETILLKCS